VAAATARLSDHIQPLAVAKELLEETVFLDL
jgi:hypothetical protein